MEHRRTTRTLLKPLLLLGALFVCGSLVFAQSNSPLSMVDPFIGTGPDGHTWWRLPIDTAKPLPNFITRIQ